MIDLAHTLIAVLKFVLNFRVHFTVVWHALQFVGMLAWLYWHDFLKY